MQTLDINRETLGISNSNWGTWTNFCVLLPHGNWLIEPNLMDSQVYCISTSCGCILFIWFNWDMDPQWSMIHTSFDIIWGCDWIIRLTHIWPILLLINAIFMNDIRMMHDISSILGGQTWAWQYGESLSPCRIWPCLQVFNGKIADQWRYQWRFQWEDFYAGFNGKIHLKM